jgi:hypothetical protein
MFEQHERIFAASRKALGMDVLLKRPSVRIPDRISEGDKDTAAP